MRAPAARCPFPSSRTASPHLAVANRARGRAGFREEVATRLGRFVQHGQEGTLEALTVGRARVLGASACAERRHLARDAAFERRDRFALFLRDAAELTAHPGERRGVRIEGELVGDALLCALHPVHQARECRVAVVEGELAHDLVDAALERLGKLAVVGTELAQQAREGPVVVIEGELAQDALALTAERLVDGTLDPRDDAFAVLRIERAHERALGSDVRAERARQRGVRSFDLAADHARQLAVLVGQRLHPLGEAPTLRVEVFAQRASQGELHGVAVLDEVFLERLEHVLDLAAHSLGVDLPAGGAHREHPDPQRGQDVRLALAFAAKGGELLDHLGVSHAQCELAGVGEIAFLRIDGSGASKGRGGRAQLGDGLLGFARHDGSSWPGKRAAGKLRSAS